MVGQGLVIQALIDLAVALLHYCSRVEPNFENCDEGVCVCVYLNTFILGISVIDIHISDLCVQAVSAILFKVCFSCIKDLSVIKDTSTLFFLFLVS